MRWRQDDYKYYPFTEYTCEEEHKPSTREPFMWKMQLYLPKLMFMNAFIRIDKRPSRDGYWWTVGYNRHVRYQDDEEDVVLHHGFAMTLRDAMIDSLAAAYEEPRRPLPELIRIWEEYRALMSLCSIGA